MNSNKFKKARENKHGFINKIKERLEEQNKMEIDYNGALPIWELLKMTETEYMLEYVKAEVLEEQEKDKNKENEDKKE